VSSRPGSSDRVVLLDENDELWDNDEHSLYGPILLAGGRLRRLTHYGASLHWAAHAVDPIPQRMSDLFAMIGLDDE
jgi:hypothetical protein